MPSARATVSMSSIAISIMPVVMLPPPLAVVPTPALVLEPSIGERAVCSSSSLGDSGGAIPVPGDLVNLVVESLASQVFRHSGSRDERRVDFGHRFRHKDSSFCAYLAKGGVLTSTISLCYSDAVLWGFRLTVSTSTSLRL